MRSEAYTWFVRGAGLAFGAALTIAILYALLQGVEVLVLVFLAVLLASGAEPLIDQVRSRSRLGRGATLLLAYFFIFGAIAVLALLIVPAAINQVSTLGTKLTPLLESAHAWAETIEPDALSAALIGLIEAAQGAVSPSAPTVPPEPDQIIAVGLTFAELAISLVSLLALIYFWLTERARLQRFALAMVPADRRSGTRDAWNQIELRLGGWVRGQLILMGSVGVATTIAYFVIGLEGALLLGLLAALFEAIPLIGPALGAVPALVVAAATGRIEIVILVAVVYFVIQLVEGNILVPLVMHNTIGIPPFIVFVSILAGAAIAGIPGALLAVPIAASIIVVAERLQARDSPVPISPQPQSEVVEVIEESA